MVRVDRPVTLRYCWRSGCTPRWRGWAAHGSWPGCAGSTTPSVGCAVACRWTTIFSRTLEWNTRKALDQLLTQIVATLMAQDLVTLDEVAQDGLRVRASAGSGSFRRKGGLEEYLEAAQRQVERLTQEREHPDPGVTRREWAARERAAQERLERVGQALAQMPAMEAAKKRQAKHAGKARQSRLREARVSTTDAEARVMKMPDGGSRPAYNVQLATDVESQVIVGVAGTKRGTDQGEGLAVEEQVAQRTGRHPGAYLVDGGFVDLEDIRTLEGRGVQVYATQGAEGRPVGALEARH